MTTNIADIVDRVDALPALPGTALKLMAIINDPDSTVEQIVATIKYDQAVTGEVLRLCNSAHYGLGREVTSLNDAMMCLGTATVLQLVLAVHTSAVLSNEQKGYGLDPGALWRHSVAVALAAGLLSKKMRLTNASLVFTAGLLHDVGKVVLNEYVAEEFAEIARMVKEEKKSFSEAEHDVLGFSHQEVGGIVAEKWNLPDPIARCIRYHHTPGELDPPDTLVDAVHLANCICLLMGVGLGEDGLYCRADSAVLQRHDLKEQDIESVGADMLIELVRVEQVASERKGGSGATGEAGPEPAKSTRSGTEERRE